MTNENIIRKVRLARLKSFLLSLLAVVIFAFSIYYSVFRADEKDILTIVLSVIFFAIGLIFLIKNILLLIVPMNEKIFRRAGSVEDAAALVYGHSYADVEYTDRYVTITPFAISFNRNSLHIVDVYDILAVFKERRSIDSVFETDCLIIIDAWGEQHAVQYRRRQQKDVDKAIEALKKVCDPKLTKFGRTMEAVEWVSQNQQVLPKYDTKTKSFVSAYSANQEPLGDQATETSSKKNAVSSAKNNSSKKANSSSSTRTSKKPQDKKSTSKKK
ncbi:hypothetical protein IJ847_01840 [Candidatus Saccharibacteria bacterium]|nr:hypothetical protein [Candidatus Saccharibacteria bacterium]